MFSEVGCLAIKHFLKPCFITYRLSKKAPRYKVFSKLIVSFLKRQTLSENGRRIYIK